MKLLTTLAEYMAHRRVIARHERACRDLARIVEANRNSPACKDYVRHRAAQKGRAV